MTNFNSLLSRSRNYLESNTELRAFSPGSIARSILEAYTDVAGEIMQTLDQEVVSSFISSAFGDDLDKVGKLVGTERNQTQYALGQVTFEIDPLSGKTLSDLKDIIFQKTGVLPGTIVIKAGTEITNANGTILYNTVSDITLDDSPVSADALSSNIGSAGNIASGELSRFSNVSDSLIYIIDFLLVSNKAPIDSGANDETDENYRFRIINAFASAARANTNSIRLAALSVPGVADVRVRNYEYGIGSVGVFVISESPIVSQGILNAVQQSVTNAMSVGERAIVSAPSYRAVRMQIRLEFKPTTNVGDKDGICITVRDNAINYINNLELGEELIINRVGQIILDTSDQIQDYTIEKFGFGEYNFQTGLIDYYQPALVVNQPLAEIEKFVTNTKLLSTCY